MGSMAKSEPKSFDVVIAGGGAGGITVAQRLLRLSPQLSIAVIEPSKEHYYQPMWTLVGAGVATFESTQKKQSEVMPKDVTWICDRVEAFSPEKNQLETKENGTIQYETLVVSMGLELLWENVIGLSTALGKNGVCSNYSAEWVSKTWESLQQFRGGTALFTHPNTPIKCGGAPQKIMYLAEHLFRKRGIREKSRVVFRSAAASIFAVPRYAEALSRVIKNRQIEAHFGSNLIAVDGNKKIATFQSVLGSNVGEKTEVPFDFLHVTPPMGPPKVVKASALAGQLGWLEVNKATLQHVRFSNVFGVGDVTDLPTSKTAAAIRKQAPVLVSNLMKYRQGKKLTAEYDGYTSCPLVTGYGKLILAEFDYAGKPCESFPFDQSKERLSMYLLKKHVLPKLYWEGMLKGRA